jgi:hypothetical protein
MSDHLGLCTGLRLPGHVASTEFPHTPSGSTWFFARSCTGFEAVENRGLALWWTSSLVTTITKHAIRPGVWFLGTCPTSISSQITLSSRTFQLAHWCQAPLSLVAHASPSDLSVAPVSTVERVRAPYPFRRVATGEGVYSLRPRSLVRATHPLPQPGRTGRILRSAGCDVSPPMPAALRSAGCR